MSANSGAIESCGVVFVCFSSAILPVAISLHPLHYPLPIPCALHGQTVFLIFFCPWYPNIYRFKIFSLNNKAVIKIFFLFPPLKKYIKVRLIQSKVYF